MPFHFIIVTYRFFNLFDGSADEYMNRMKCWLGCSWSQISTKVNYSASTFEAELQAGTKMAFYAGVVPKTLKVVTVCPLPLSLA